MAVPLDTEPASPIRRTPGWMLIAGGATLPLLGGLLVLLFGQWLLECNLPNMTATYPSTSDSQAAPPVVLIEESGSAPPPASRFLVDPFPVRGPMRWEHLSRFMQAEYSMNGTIAISPWYFDETVANIGPQVWTTEVIEEKIKLTNSRTAVTRLISQYGSEANQGHFDALDKYPIKGMSVLIIGSQKPWIEAICLSFGAALVTTVDFNPPIVNYPKLRTISIPELDASDEKFDAVFSYSSLEHDGLGRYGDPLDPDGDLKRMEKIKGLVKPGGKFYLGLPNGNDTIQYNAHRIYGRIRFPVLIKGWKLLDTFGMSLEDCYNLPWLEQRQPLHVLTLP